MKMISSNRVIKFIFLAAVLILMLALCGCRTRVTNNSEVTNVMYDEDGMLTDTRRTIKAVSPSAIRFYTTD